MWELFFSFVSFLEIDGIFYYLWVKKQYSRVHGFYFCTGVFADILKGRGEIINKKGMYIMHFGSQESSYHVLKGRLE